VKQAGGGGREHRGTMELNLYTRVRVCKLEHKEESYDGWGINQKAPRVGDVGFLMDILRAPDLPAKFVVEMSDPSDGTVIWLSEFYREELEPLKEG
jgi:hypothetical protein